MKKYLFALLFVPVLFLTSCKQDPYKKAAGEYKFSKLVVDFMGMRLDMIDPNGTSDLTLNLMGMTREEYAQTCEIYSSVEITIGEDGTIVMTIPEREYDGEIIESSSLLNGEYTFNADNETFVGTMYNEDNEEFISFDGRYEKKQITISAKIESDDSDFSVPIKIYGALVPRK